MPATIKTARGIFLSGGSISSGARVVLLPLPAGRIDGVGALSPSVGGIDGVGASAAFMAAVVCCAVPAKPALPMPYAGITPRSYQNHSPAHAGRRNRVVWLPKTILCCTSFKVSVSTSVPRSHPLQPPSSLRLHTNPRRNAANSCGHRLLRSLYTSECSLSTHRTLTRHR